MNAFETGQTPTGIRVAMFPDAFSKEIRTVALDEVLEAIRGGKYADQIQSLRELRSRDHEAYDKQKRTLPAFCISGTANGRKSPLEHSGYLQIDLDKLNGSLETVRAEVKQDPHVGFGFVSPSGDGLKLGLRIHVERHAESFEAATIYFHDRYKLTIDPAVKDRLRLCFVSDDPNLWQNVAATPLPVPDTASTQPLDVGTLTGIVLPSGAVSFSESARAIFQRMAPTRTLFWRGGALVEVIEQGGIAGLEIVKPDHFRSRVERIANLFAWRSGANGEPVLKPARLSRDDAAAIAATLEARELLPPIACVLRCPTLIEKVDGNLDVLGKGYHPEQGGLLIVAGVLPPVVELGKAAKSLQWLIEEFEFQSPGDRSRALAALLTPALRSGGFISGSIPIDVAEADQSQSGKGYRHHLVCALYNESGYFVTCRQGGVGSVDESFAAALIAGRPFICLDNFRGKLDSQHLEAFVTCPGLFPARIPHKGEVMLDPKKFVLQMSSNGMEATRDLANRSSICRIRKRPGFGYRDTLGELQRRQPYFLGCVFAVVREWVAHGKPVTNCTAHDFRKWSQPLDWIVQNLLDSAPLMEGHQTAQERVSNPALSWLRSVALSLAAESKLGQPSIASEISETCEINGIEIPGLRRGNEEHSARQIGCLMRRLFKDSDNLAVDGFQVAKTSKQYQTKRGDWETTPAYNFTKCQ